MNISLLNVNYTTNYALFAELGVPTPVSNFRHSDTDGSRIWSLSRVSEVAGQKCRKSRCRKSRFEFRHLDFVWKMKTTFCIWNWNVVFIWPCVLLFWGESRRHLELFSGIAHEFSRAKLTEMPTRPKPLEQAPVFQLMLPRQHLF